MSVFTPLSRDTLAALLGRWRLSLVDFRGATEGIENSNFLLETRDETGGHRPLVLTVFERTGYAELPPLVTLLARLAGTGLPVPEPLPDIRGRCIQMVEGKPAMLVPRLPGEHPRTPDAALCRELGSALGRLHAGGVDPRGGLDDAEQLLRLAAWTPDDRAREVLRAWTRARTELPAGLIHGDLFRDNVLVADGRITGLLDFYSAGSGAWLFDLAVCLNDWTGADSALETAVLAGYEAERALTGAEREALPLALSAAALRFWLSRLEAQSRELSGEGRVEKDPEEFARLFGERYRAWLD